MLALLPAALLITGIAISLWAMFVSFRRLDLAVLDQGSLTNDIDYRLRGIGVVPVGTSQVRRPRPVTVRWTSPQRSVERAAA